jgi:hypothetical protein
MIKRRHVAQAAKTQVRVVLVALLIVTLYIASVQH